MDSQTKIIPENFEFKATEKRNFLILIGVGVLGLILAAIFSPENHLSRMWSNVLLNTYYFMGISLCGLVFITVHQLGLSGWHNVLRRIPEAFGAFVPVMGVVMLILVIANFTGLHQLYSHWTVHEVHGTKKVLLNPVTWSGLVLLFVALWVLFSFIIRKKSIEEDTAPSLSLYQQSKYISAAFILVFAVTSSVGSWLIIMSLDPHWYSTLFGWYNFASYMIASLCFLTLIIIYLKSRGYLRQVNENHVHDIGKYIFGFSVFWAYLWFSQFMLIWYGNIPEDTAWFLKRREVPLYSTLMYVNVIINFALPLLMLMRREAKRQFKWMGIISVILIFGHWLDYFIMVMPEPNAIVAHDDHGHGDDHGDHHDDHSSIDANEMKVIFADHHEGDDDSSMGEGDDHAHDHGDDDNHSHEGDDHDHDAGHDHEGEDHAHDHEGDGHEHNDDAHVHNGDGHDDDHGAAAHGGHGDHGHGGHDEPEVTYAGVGIFELMIFLGFMGGFLFTVFNALEKAPLVPLKNPYIKESIDHHI